ncbi:MAG: imidazole glycerol phosphate synthase subunit HisF [Thermoanaerobaculia bacterium]
MSAETTSSLARPTTRVGEGSATTELARRVIPCLDVADGRVVKGVRFVDLEPLDDPPTAAARYAEEGADEIVFLDVTAAPEARRPGLALVSAVAERLLVPLTVGGGVRSAADARDLLLAGADKVALNSAAVERPTTIGEIASRFGSQCAVVSVDARRRASGGWEVVTHGGRRASGRDALGWIDEAVARGAGEILLTSIDRDGTGGGYDLDLLAAVVARVRVPVVASGGASSIDDFAAALAAGAAAVLAASVFHRGRLRVDDLKAALAGRGFPMRATAVGSEGR